MSHSIFASSVDSGNKFYLISKLFEFACFLFVCLFLVFSSCILKEGGENPLAK